MGLFATTKQCFKRKTMNRKVLYLALIFGMIRAILLFYHNPNLIMNIDEESNFEVATNHFNGKGYTYYDPDLNTHKPTAFHSSFTIFVYENVLLKNHIHKRKWVAFCNVLSALLLAVSIVYFYQLSLFFLNQKEAYYSTILYCIFPSVVYYIGTLFWYEQLVLSVLIIIIYLCIKFIKNNLSTFEHLGLISGIILCSLFRLQTLAIFAPLLICLLLFFTYKASYKKAIYISVIFVLGFIAHVPSLIKNKNIYGAYILSTQPGYEILQGHNPYAKGSWMGDWLISSSDLYKYSYEKIEKLDQLNQYEEGLARKKVAIDWIKSHPFDEVKLIFRKLALYFLPRNFEFLPLNQFPNPINFAVYMGFLLFMGLSIKNKFKMWDFEKIILVIPFIGSIALTLVFFMGARWRYYAEPFMIIFAMLAFTEIVSKYNFFKNKFERFQK